MSIPVFTPLRAADQGAKVQIKPKTINSQLGDGYVQRTPDGINTMLRKLTLSWTNLTDAEGLQIQNFFTQQAGVYPFYYTPNGETVQRCFVCSDWTYTYINGGFCTLSNVVFEEAAPF